MAPDFDPCELDPRDECERTVHAFWAMPAVMAVVVLVMALFVAQFGDEATPSLDADGALVPVANTSIAPRKG